MHQIKEIQTEDFYLFIALAIIETCEKFDVDFTGYRNDVITNVSKILKMFFEIKEKEIELIKEGVEEYKEPIEEIKFTS
jgi:hypothetical protein